MEIVEFTARKRSNVVGGFVADHANDALSFVMFAWLELCFYNITHHISTSWHPLCCGVVCPSVGSYNLGSKASSDNTDAETLAHGKET
jgi:hypothetical protein